MSERVLLKGIAWDHPRGSEPLRATSIAFAKKNLNVSIEWDFRTLKEFGDLPINDLITQYDLITIDHPFMGEVDEKKLLIPLEDFIPASDLITLECQSVGPSFESYRYKSHLYALPIDASALVSAYRDDLITNLNIQPPFERNSLFEFYKKIPNDFKVAMPLCPTDLWCIFLTICVQDAGRNFIENKQFDGSIGVGALDELKKHLNSVHPKSLNWNPIQILDYMGTNDDIIYCPFLFGYTNYSRGGFKKNLVTFGNSPINPKNSVSTVLGGVGVSISSRCKFPEWAAKFINCLTKSKVQESIYTENGGQPGNVKAWQNKANNKLCNNYFKNTYSSMKSAYVRPRHSGWNRFQEKGAKLLHECLVKDLPSHESIKNLNQLYQTIV
ncbi:MAG: ABC transporter substrate-binding protein [Flavobacteriaceae bacterium]|nr:ABC transporter substrate-binding protein [Flavobacteriaceae bacterium]